jgi:T5SS/PEP-CTERM-associated repeat protein
MTVANNAGAQGDLNVAGGVASVFSSLVQGNYSCTSTGTVGVNGGSLFVTNAGASATFDVRSGTLTLNSGTLTVNRLVMTNACGRFVRTGGTLTVSTKVLSPNLDADGDGLPNGWEELYSFDPLDSRGNNGPDGDPDGDGYTNLQEYQLGINPLLDDRYNNWTGATNGSWEQTNRWSSASRPSLINWYVFITNATSKTVMINDVTASTYTNSLTVSNLVVSAPSGTVNTLVLSNMLAGSSTPLQTVGTFTIGFGGALLITNSNLKTAGLWDINGQVALLGSAVTNLDAVALGTTAGSTGTVLVAAGQWTATNASSVIYVGDVGVGQMTVSNGTVLARSVQVGYEPGARGAWISADGNTVVTTSLTAGDLGEGTILVTGGSLTATNLAAGSFIGRGGSGRLSMSGGAVAFGALTVGDLAGAAGTLSVSNGTLNVLSSLLLGASGCGATGTVNVAGGSVFVTNAFANATLEIRSGSVLLSGGFLRVDRFVMTNACAQFIQTGGLLSYGIAVLAPDGDTDADGLPNGWEQANGLDPLSATGVNGATGDPDNDGFSNAKEYTAGTSPVDPNSFPRIISIVQEGANDVRVTWPAVGGKNYRLQTNSVPGSVGFADLSPTIAVPMSGLTTTNYLHTGGASTSNRFYRVKIMP